MKTRLLQLARSRGVNRNLIKDILETDPCLERFFDMDPQQIGKTFNLSIDRARTVYNDLHNAQLASQIERDSTNCHIITYFDELYPDILRQIKDPPYVLYALGNLDLLKKQPVLSVIGTRKPSNEGMKKTSFLVDPLAEAGWVIVSGMARGIDGYAHRRTLDAKGKTVAVLGSGFGHIYPRDHFSLFCEIATEGLVLSEYPPDAPPQKFHFPERNRIISGLGFGTLVIEAMERSGTLITVEQALDQGREVYAVPGSPLNVQASGCHQMIQDGAKLVTRGEEIMEDWASHGHLLFEK